MRKAFVFVAKGRSQVMTMYATLALVSRLVLRPLLLSPSENSRVLLLIASAVSRSRARSHNGMPFLFASSSAGRVKSSKPAVPMES